MQMISFKWRIIYLVCNITCHIAPYSVQIDLNEIRTYINWVKNRQSVRYWGVNVNYLQRTSEIRARLQCDVFRSEHPDSSSSNTSLHNLYRWTAIGQSAAARGSGIGSYQQSLYRRSHSCTGSFHCVCTCGIWDDFVLCRRSCRPGICRPLFFQLYREMYGVRKHPWVIVADFSNLQRFSMNEYE